MLAPLYTGLAFCCLTHVATQKVSDAFQPAAALSRYAGAALRPDTAAHELVLSERRELEDAARVRLKSLKALQDDVFSDVIKERAASAAAGPVHSVSSHLEL